MNIVDVLFAVEFQELIRITIPQIITFLSHSTPYICSEVADTLVKLSEQGKVSNYLTLISIVDVPVAEFRELIQSTIPEINVFLSDPDKIHHVGAYILPKISRQGKISFVLV